MTSISSKPMACSRPSAGRRPGVRSQTVNTDGWALTRNAFQALFPLITVVLCFLHGFLKIRDRCRKAHELHGRVWDVYRAATAEEFRRLMNELQQWCATQTWNASVCGMLENCGIKQSLI